MITCDQVVRDRSNTLNIDKYLPHREGCSWVHRWKIMGRRNRRRAIAMDDNTEVDRHCENDGWSITFYFTNLARPFVFLWMNTISWSMWLVCRYCRCSAVVPVGCVLLSAWGSCTTEDKGEERHRHHGHKSYAEKWWRSYCKLKTIVSFIALRKKQPFRKMMHIRDPPMKQEF